MKHFEGQIGNFDYDENLWKVDDDGSSLRYVGEAEKVELPKGVTSCNRMFEGLDSVNKLDLSAFDTTGVTDMSYMFYGCDVLTELDVSGLHTEQVTDMSHMFDGCLCIKELDVSH